jgi:squalene synthase HpnC
VVTTRSLPYTHIGSFSPAADVPPGLPSDSEILGRSAQENFTVASRVLPKAARGHLLAFYGYARLVDELGDSYPGDRLGALDWLAEETGRALAEPRDSRSGLVANAARSLNELGLDPTPLYQLIDANRQDQTTTAYETFDDLVSYCSRSANPIGRLVLGALGLDTAQRVRLSDFICTGLQLTEHWQDVVEDAAAGRVYLPQEDLLRFGVTDADLRPGSATSPDLRGLMSFEVARARGWLDEGRPLIATLKGRPRWAVAGFWAGGQAALDAIATRRFDVLSGPPRPNRGRLARHLIRSLISYGARRESR